MLKYYIAKTKIGDLSAYYQIGFLYQNGLGGHKNAKKAEEYYEYAARKGHIEAQRTLGNMYAHGFFEINPDKQKAIYYYTLASEQGNEEAINKLKWLHRE